jgi:hypothetical protein
VADQMRALSVSALIACPRFLTSFSHAALELTEIVSRSGGYAKPQVTGAAG